MKLETQKLFSLLFNEGEEACVSPDQYPYHSLLVEDLWKGSFELVPNTDKQKSLFCSIDDVKLVSLNPIKGARNDENVTAFRTFLVEMDDGGLAAQKKYIEDMGMPYTVCVFSGGKSLHFGITLDVDLPSLDIYKFYAEWILAVMNKADPNTKNPSRMIRVPGAVRDGVEQRLVESRDRISLDDLKNWLAPYDGLAPRPEEKRVGVAGAEASILSLPKWAQNELLDGIDRSKGRNNRWFAIAYECGLLGFSEDDTIALLGNFFEPERDFGRSEWDYTVRNAVGKSQKG